MNLFTKFEYFKVQLIKYLNNNLNCVKEFKTAEMFQELKYPTKTGK